MADMSAFGAVVTSLRFAGDITKAMVALRDHQMIQAKVIELQGVILTAQSSALAAQSDQSTLLDSVRELEQEIVRLKDWEAEKKRYELRDAGRGAFAYMQKLGVDTGEPPHWLCANCFSKRQKSILQFRGQNQVPGGPRSETSRYGCDSCNATLVVGYRVSPQTLAGEAASPASGA